MLLINFIFLIQFTLNSLKNTSRAIIEHPLWINCDKAEQGIQKYYIL